MSEYHDLEGNPVALEKLIRLEPGWAANHIRAERAEIARLTRLLLAEQAGAAALREEVRRGVWAECASELKQAAGTFRDDDLWDRLRIGVLGSWAEEFQRRADAP